MGDAREAGVLCPGFAVHALTALVSGEAVLAHGASSSWKFRRPVVFF